MFSFRIFFLGTVCNIALFSDVVNSLSNAILGKKIFQIPQNVPWEETKEEIFCTQWLLNMGITWKGDQQSDMSCCMKNIILYLWTSYDDSSHFQVIRNKDASVTMIFEHLPSINQIWHESAGSYIFVWSGYNTSYVLLYMARWDIDLPSQNWQDETRGSHI